jgi:DNA-binding transcriptional LysR family regulator
MYDSVTLDQLRALLAVVEEGSFSAAARKLKRVQSAVSTSMANLETHLGVPLWDRSTKVARLTPQGTRVVGGARRVLMEADALRRLTEGMAGGVEASVSLCVDALFPVTALIDLCTGFSKAFPNVDLRLDTQLMSAVSARVLSGDATLGVVSPGGLVAGLERRVLASVRMVPVVSPQHPLARIRGSVQNEQLAEATQIVLSERSDAKAADQAVLSLRTWRVADLHTKHRLLCAGLGWGNLPDHLVHEDLRARRLVAIRPQAWAEEEHTLYLSAIYRSDQPLGPAHRWLLGELPSLCARDLEAKPGGGTKRRSKSLA